MAASDNEARFDALLPQEMAVKAEAVGVNKAKMDWLCTFVLAVLAGAFIGLGAVFATTVSAGLEGQVPYGIIRLLSGLAFSLGLILVIVGGAELFTGNNLILMALASRKVGMAQLARNWSIVYVGNFVGSVLTVAIVFLAETHNGGHGAVGAAALATANGKCQVTFVRGIASGMMCNALVCMAVWMTYSARSTTDKILAMIPPITAFVAVGFEHCVANMYFIPMGIAIKAFAPEAFWTQIGNTPADFAAITSYNFFVSNLIPVTIGNMIGGALMVGAMYWFVFSRRRRQALPPA